MERRTAPVVNCIPPQQRGCINFVRRPRCNLLFAVLAYAAQFETGRGIVGHRSERASAAARLRFQRPRCIPPNVTE